MYATRQHEELTKRAKQIFGPIVKAAFIVHEHSARLDEEEKVMSEYLKDSLEDRIVFDTGDDIFPQTIQITFISGYTVQFQNSEWSSIRKIKEQD